MGCKWLGARGGWREGRLGDSLCDVPGTPGSALGPLREAGVQWALFWVSRHSRLKLCAEARYQLRAVGDADGGVVIQAAHFNKGRYVSGGLRRAIDVPRRQWLNPNKGPPEWAWHPLTQFLCLRLRFGC